MNWLDRIPLLLILPIAAFMAFAPFVPEPHLWEKMRMLVQGTLRRPIDIFDLFWHGVPVLVLFLKVARMMIVRGAGPRGT